MEYCINAIGLRAQAVYVSNACIILNVIGKARRHNMSLRSPELDPDRALLNTDQYRIMMQVRTHYCALECRWPAVRATFPP